MFSLGALAHESQAGWLLSLASVFEPAGVLWTNALRMIALPLMVSYLMLAINSATRTRTAGRLGGLSLLAFLLFLVLAGALTLAVAPRLFEGLTIDADARAVLQSMSAAGHETAERAGQAHGFAQRIVLHFPAYFLDIFENVNGI